MLIPKASVRKAWLDLPPINLFATKAVLKRFTVAEQYQLVREISGSFQTSEQQAVWDPMVDSSCKFCGEHDDRFHRSFKCACTQHIRDNFPDTVSYYSTDRSHVAELPVIHRHAEEEWLRCCQWQPKDLQIHPHIKNKLEEAQKAGKVLSFYTDGSCQHPADPVSRTATFAVIVDLAESNEEREAWAKNWNESHPFPPTFLPLAMCHSSKNQSIGRAELEALVFLAENFDDTQAFSDSSSALSVAEKCKHMTTPAELQQHADADLATRLWNASVRGHRIYQKVKAHDLDNVDDSLLSRYHKIGNHVADYHAKQALAGYLPHIKQTSDTVYQALSEAKQQLEQYFKMLLQMFQHKAKLDEENKTVPNRAETQRIHEAFVQGLCNWSIASPWQPQPLIEDQTWASSWGYTLTQALTEWMQQVQWPNQLDFVDPSEVGVTWIELALSFIFTVGIPIPVKRKHPNGKEYLVLCQNQAHMIAIDLRLGEMGDTLQKWITQVLGLQSPPQWPQLSKGLVRSLYTLGSSFQSSGVHTRPSFPKQAEVTTTMREYLKTHEGTSYNDMPPFTFHAAVDFVDQIKAELVTDWETSCKLRQEEARKMKRRVDRLGRR
eukprot:Skav200191  [mRNA]  locus=scaffold2383:203540:205357:+ [translate_table: standard]